MEAVLATARNSRLAVLAVGALPAAVAGAAAMLDQSMRRPSLAGMVLQSLRLAF